MAEILPIQQKITINQSINQSVDIFITIINLFHHFLINCTAMFTIARLEVMLITERKVFVKYTTIIDKCKNKRNIVLNC